MKFSSTEPKFDISIKNITGKNTFLNSKNAFSYFARLFRPWVISAMGYFGPELFQFVDLFILNQKRGKQKQTSFGVRFFLFFYFKDTKEHSSECHSIENTFFLKKIESHRFS